MFVNTVLRLGVVSLFLASLLSCAEAPETVQEDAKAPWRKGNTHTHTLWSDGDAPPELVIKWYVDNDYNFLVLSDHNLIQTSEDWFPIAPDSRLTLQQVDLLRETFGDNWPDIRDDDGTSMMRLRTLSELKSQFDVADEFCLIPGEEVTDRFEKKEVHINALNVDEVIRPQRGSSVSSTIQRNLDAIIAFGEAHNQEVLAHLNHPNFAWSITVEELASMRGERFFEIYNGHRSTNNAGDATHPSTEQLWDEALVLRLHEGLGDGNVLYGLATDDAHNHYELDEVSVPGRGWVMVRSKSLDEEAIIKAMKSGDFYSSSGVVLHDVYVDEDVLSIDIDTAPGATYLTEFIGTRLDTGVLGDIGEVLYTSTSKSPRYTMKGDELYVRARITSSEDHPRPYAKGDHKMAWVQPVRPQVLSDSDIPVPEVIRTLPAKGAASKETKTITWDVDGVARTALVRFPELAEGEQAPLVFIWHGHGGKSKSAARKFGIHTHWPQAIVVHPQGLPTPGKLTDPNGLRPGWQTHGLPNENRDLDFFDVMYADLMEQGIVDPDRVYSTGHSNGGAFTYTLFFEREELLAAIAPSSAAAIKYRDRTIPKMGIFHLAGRKDTLVKMRWQQATINHLRRFFNCDEPTSWGGHPACKMHPSPDGNYLYTYVHEGGHRMPDDAGEIFTRFFQNQTR